MPFIHLPHSRTLNFQHGHEKEGILGKKKNLGEELVAKA